MSFGELIAQKHRIAAMVNELGQSSSSVAISNQINRSTVKKYAWKVKN
jgi:hypothetical protein